MTSRDFAFWLQGYFELQNSQNIALNNEQVKVIKNHLAMVFKHEIDPSMGNEQHQQELNNLHKPDQNDFDPKSTLIRC